MRAPKPAEIPRPAYAGAFRTQYTAFLQQTQAHGIHSPAEVPPAPIRPAIRLRGRRKLFPAPATSFSRVQAGCFFNGIMVQ